MKKTIFIELFKNIKRTFVSFMSITIFIILGLGFVEGLLFSSKSIDSAMDVAFKECNSYDLAITYALGIKNEQIDSFKTIDGIDEAEGSFIAYEQASFNGNLYSSSIISITSKINTLIVREGKLPENDKEIAVVYGCANKFGLKIGDKVKFNNGNGQINFLTSVIRDSNDSNYIKSALESKNKNNFINDEFTVTGLVTHPFYLSESKDSYGTSPYDLSQISATFFVNYSAFNPCVINNSYNCVYLKSNELKDLKTDEIYRKQNALLVNKVQPVADQVGDEIYNSCLGNAESIALNINTFYPLIKSFVDAGILNSEQFSTVEKANEYFKSVEEKLSLYKVAYIQNRYANPIITFDSMIADIVGKNKYIIGGMFIFISFCICYSLISRLVFDDLKLIGTKKALGLTKKEIVFNYIGYVLFAAIIGSILAVPFGFLVEYILINSLKGPFNFVIPSNYFSFLVAILVSLMAILITILIAYFTCNKILKEPARQLLLGEQTNVHKFKTKSSSIKTSKTSLLNRTIWNNLKTDKRRVIATLIGIASSACLIVGSLTMKTNINSAFATEYSDYIKFDSFVFFDSTKTNSKSNFSSYFDSKNYEYCLLYRERATFTVDNGEERFGYVMVYDDVNSFSKLASFESSNKDNIFKYEGIWLPESFQKYSKCDDVVETTIHTTSNLYGTGLTSGFYKYYSYMALIFMDSSTFKTTFNKTFEPNIFAINSNDDNTKMLKDDLVEIDGFTSFIDYYGYACEDQKVFDSISISLSICCCVVTVLMSLFNTLDLLITFVKEKKKELITMIINGYSRKEAAKYIYSDTIFLTIIGLIIGSGIGILFGNMIIMTFESTYLHFLHYPSVISILIGVVSTSLLVFIMSLISINKIEKFKLTDINASSL